MEEIGKFYRKVCFARFRAPAATDFSQQLSNEFSQRYFGRAAKEFRCNQLIAWSFQAEDDQHFVKLRQIARAKRRKLALHQSQRQTTDRPAFARFATRGSQQELEKSGVVSEVDQKLPCELQNCISIFKIPLDGGLYFCRNGASALAKIQFRTCS